MGPNDLRVSGLLTRRASARWGTVVAQLAALRFFYLRVLKRRHMREDLPYPKRPRRLPIILSPKEVQRLIAGAQNLFHSTVLMTLYGGGLRRSELLHLKVSDIDSQRRAAAAVQSVGDRPLRIPRVAALAQNGQGALLARVRLQLAAIGGQLKAMHRVSGALSLRRVMAYRVVALLYPQSVLF